MTAMVVFDFDGVLVDTIEECLTMAFTTARRLAGQSVEPPPREVAESFLAHRHLVGPPWQYAVLLECIARGEIPDAAGFALLSSEREVALAGFTDAYFAARTELSADQPRWLSTMRPYDAALRVFREQHEQGAWILSTRDAASIEKILRHFTGVVPRQLPRAGPRPKWETLVDVARRTGVPEQRILFIDDHLPHVLPAKQRGISAQLASWGYLGPSDLDDAAAAGVRCLSLDELHSAVHQHQEAS
jgi:HAD superfamily hydrolase (TIGR01509 family)